MTVPVLDLTRQYQSIKEEIDEAVLRVVASGRYILGADVASFERATADYCGVRRAIGVASGTDALLLSLRALDIGPGDAVILPSFTFFATAGVVHNVGALPVFCDIDPRTFNLDPAHLRSVLSNWPQSRGDSNLAVTPRAVIPVHLYGQVADMREILAIADEYGLAVIEDAAQAIGATYSASVLAHEPQATNHELNGPHESHEFGPPARAGTLGDLGCFSFYPTKNLGAYGDAGMVISNDDALAERVGLLRVHGAEPKYYHRMVGVNSRLDAIQAAILDVKLRHLDEWSAARVAVADRYDRALGELDELVTPYRAQGRSHIFHQYTVRVPGGRRDALARHLHERGIGTMIYYPVPLHLQECFAHLGYRQGMLPESERAADEVLSLPIFPELTVAEQQTVIDAISAFF